MALIARPGLASFVTVGDGPIRAVFQRAGLFGGDMLILSAQTLYRVTTGGAVTAFTGTIDGDDLVDVDAGQDADLNSVARFATGSALYKAVGTTVTQEDFPSAGGAGASSVCFHRNFWFASVAGTDQVFYQVPGDATWDALSFMSAEFTPDKIVAIRSVGDMVVFLGSDSFEPWTLTGSDTVPFVTPYGGLASKIGCRSRATAVSVKDALIWVDNNNSVQMFEGGGPSMISDNGLAEQISRVSAADLSAAWFTKDQHTFYVLKLGSEATWAYDLATRMWVKFSSQDYDFWRATLFCTAGESTYASDAITAQVYRLDTDLRTDAGEGFPVMFTALLEVKSGVVPVANLELACEVGASPREGQGSDPLIQMRFSDDAGHTYGQWRQRPLGATGQYRTRVRWNGLGQAEGPWGRLFQFRVTDPVGRRFYLPMVNV